MILLVDVGNSRVKWAVLADGELSPQRAAAHAAWTVDDWQRELCAEAGLERVVAASVAGDARLAALREAAARRGLPFAAVATQAEAAGVRNAYPDPRLLGVDRWLAVIAAYSLTGAACCVLDVGTAATIDAVTGVGRHLGGYILPGPDLMVTSLLRGTSDLAAHTQASGAVARSLFATNTRDAIERGAVVALAALADRSVADLEQQAGEPARLLVTGGGAPLVLPHLRTPARPVPDLVLRGLACLVQEKII